MSRVPMASIPALHARRKKAESVAIMHGGEILTWRDLDTRSNQRARQLIDLGVSCGDFVTVMLPNGNRFFEVVFAIWKIGATPNPVSPSTPREELKSILETVNPRLIISSSHIDTFGRNCLCDDNDLHRFDIGEFDRIPVSKYWKAMTSGGSTGRPKLIVDHHPALVDPFSPTFIQQLDGVVLNPGPLYHNAPFTSAHSALFTGSTVVGMTRFDAAEALDLIARHRVDWVLFVPTMMNRIASLVRERGHVFDVSSIRAIWHMAAPIPQWLKRWWIEWIGAEKVWEMYGGTEGLGYTAIRGDEWLTRPGSVGRLQENGQLKIVRDDGVDCDAGEIGEIFFLPEGGPGSTYHYIGADSKRLADGWESIGDMGYIDVDGYLYLADRRSDLIIRGGANIYPAEVEAALDSHPGILSSAVIGLPHGDLGQVVHAIVQLVPDAKLDPDAMAAYLRDRISKYKIPESYEVATRELRDPAGKIRRKSLLHERCEMIKNNVDFRII